MNKYTPHLSIEELESFIPRLEQDAEGHFKGGFSVVELTDTEEEDNKNTDCKIACNTDCRQGRNISCKVKCNVKTF